MLTGQEVIIVAFGDSITQAAEQEYENRWPEILKRALQARFQTLDIKMFNAGIGGNTSREGLARIEQDVLRHSPHFVTVEFGNDATHEPERHVDLDTFAGNLSRIRTNLAEHCGAELVLLTFPPVIDAWHVFYNNDFYRQQGGQDAYQERYRERTRQFARDERVALLDIDKALRNAIALRNPEEYILKDGVHLTAQGNHLVAQAVLAHLSDRIAGCFGTTTG